MSLDKPKVYCLGVFDLFHVGHLNLLYKASRMGNLYVGIVKDEAVKIMKGNNRPIINDDDRYEIITSLRFVYSASLIDKFCIPEERIREMDFIVIGEDQTHIENLNSIPYEKKIIFPRTPGISTGDIIKRIKEEK